MTKDLTIKLLDIIRDIMHSFVPYENLQRYKLLEKLQAIEVAAKGPTGKHCIMNMTLEEYEAAMKALKDLHARSEYPVDK